MIATGWKHRLKLKDIIDKDDEPESYSSETVAACAKEMHERLEAFRLKHFKNDDEIESVSDQFHTIAFIDGPAGVADVAEFDAIMNELYDWADAVRVWID
jgi:hypothetical protein